MKTIAHIDLNAFFAAAEVLRHPELKGLPIAIGQEGRRGIVSTCSYEARSFGVHSGMSVGEARAKCPSLRLVHGDFHYYHLLSRQFFKIIQSYTSIIEVTSIDECYIDITALEGDHVEVVRKIQRDVLEKTGLGCSIGLASNKFLAKMGSDLKKPMGLTVIGPDDVERLIWPLEIEKMYGVGRASAPRLRSIGINTIGDLANYSNLVALRQVLGSWAEAAIAHARGRGSDKVETETQDPKSIGTSHTLDHDSEDVVYLQAIITRQADEVCRRARRHRMVGRTVTVTIKYFDFTSRNHQVALKEYTNDSETVGYYASILLEKIVDSRPVRLVGVTLGSLISAREHYRQLDYETLRHQELLDG